MDETAGELRKTVKLAVGGEYIGPTTGKASQGDIHGIGDTGLGFEISGFDNSYLTANPQQSIAAVVAGTSRLEQGLPNGGYVAATASGLISIGSTSRMETTIEAEVGMRGPRGSVSAFAGATARSIGHKFIRETTVNPSGEMFAGITATYQSQRAPGLFVTASVWSDTPDPVQNPSSYVGVGYNF